MHQALTEISLQSGGTFYLPYRHHYSKEQMERGYPNIQSFFLKKLQYDPNNLFSSEWSENYMRQIMPELGSSISTNEVNVWHNNSPPHDLLAPPINQHFQPTFVNWEKSSSGCYRSLLSDPDARARFFEKFLTLIFSVEDNKKIESTVTKAIWNPDNQNDDDIFNDIRLEIIHSETTMNQVMKLYRAIQQSRHQKHELTRESINIISKLGKYGNLNDYVSIGDTGKMVLSFLEYNVVKGKVWVVHNTLGDIPEVIERGTEQQVGEFVFIDYKDPTRIDIPSESADLITLNQGLHHQPQDKIMGLLSEIYRILRPGGLFIVREHDASPELYPTLYLAHSVFNAVTGRTLKEEKMEIRAFRPILEWRKISKVLGSPTHFYMKSKRVIQQLMR